MIHPAVGMGVVHAHRGVCVCECERGYRLLACATLFQAPFWCGKGVVCSIWGLGWPTCIFGVLYREVNERKG